MLYDCISVVLLWICIKRPRKRPILTIFSSGTQTTSIPTGRPSQRATRRPTRRPTSVRATPNPSPRASQQPTFDAGFLAQFPFPYPYTRFTPWIQLGTTEQNSGTNLGYFSSSWDNLEIYDLESLRYSDLTVQERQSLQALGLDSDQWDCFMNHYNGYYWDELQSIGVLVHFTTLGYTQSSWDDGIDPPDTEGMYWDDLSPEQQDAANKLCYFQNSWDWIDLNLW